MKKHKHSFSTIFAGVAQLVERGAFSANVAGVEKENEET